MSALDACEKAAKEKGIVLDRTTAEARFDKMDKHKDGKLTGDERWNHGKTTDWFNCKPKGLIQRSMGQRPMNDAPPNSTALKAQIKPRGATWGDRLNRAFSADLGPREIPGALPRARLSQPLGLDCSMTERFAGLCSGT